jgi:hypothetical protein
MRQSSDDSGRKNPKLMTGDDFARTFVWVVYNYWTPLTAVMVDTMWRKSHFRFGDKACTLVSLASASQRVRWRVTWDA